MLNILNTEISTNIINLQFLMGAMKRQVFLQHKFSCSLGKKKTKKQLMTIL